MTLHSRAPITTMGNLGAFMAASAPVRTTTSALSTFLRKNSCLPKQSSGLSPLRASTQSTADRRDSGNEGGQPSATRAAR